MRRLVAILACVGIIVSAQAQTLGRIVTPTPVSLALTIGQWLFKDQKKLYYIEVESRAPTFQQARDEGFRLAVEHAVGSLILSESDVRRGQLVRDEIITYASGYVDQFELMQRIESDAGVIIQMKVWVAHSAIANRLLNTSETAGQVDGARAATQITTITQSRHAGDRVLQAVLNDYPARSFDIILDPTKVVYSHQRTGQLYVSFILRWNQKYLDSLAETVKVINQKPECNRLISRCTYVTQVEVRQPGFTSNTVGWFDDQNIWRIFQQHTMISQPRILLKILDFDRNTVYKQCFTAPELSADYASWKYVDIGPGMVVINGAHAKRHDTYIDLQTLPVERLTNVEVSVVRGSECN